MSLEAKLIALATAIGADPFTVAPRVTSMAPSSTSSPWVLRSSQVAVQVPAGRRQVPA